MTNPFDPLDGWEKHAEEHMTPPDPAAEDPLSEALGRLEGIIEVVLESKEQNSTARSLKTRAEGFLLS